MFWASGVALLVVTLVAVSVALLRPSRSEGPQAAPEEQTRSTPPPPPPPADPARQALELARAYAKEWPHDLKGRLERFRRVAWKHDGTPVGDEARREVELLRGERDKRLEARISDLDERLDPLLKASQWKEAGELLEAARDETAPPRWNLALDLRRRALEEAARKPPVSLPSPKPPPPAVSEQARVVWSKACRRAFIRDYAGAEMLLRDALAAAEDESTRREVREDLDRFAAAGRFYQEGCSTLVSTAPGTLLVLQVWGNDGQVGRVEGRLVDVHKDWMLLRRRGARFSEAMEFMDIAAAFWVADTMKDPASAALFCLLEGDVESARRLLPDEKLIPEKYWTLRQPSGPPRDALPAAWENERLARKQLAEADAKFGFLATRAEAVLAYQGLMDEYGETMTVDANRARIREQAKACREVRVPPRDFRTSGTFKRSSWASRSVRVPDCWTASEDIDWRESLENFVEVDFPALTETVYRCWIYVGGCCLESFACHFQASEYSAKDPDTGKVVAAEPGGNFAFPLMPKGFFRARHAQHARAGAPKRPERWQWIEVPLPEFMSAGLKTIRLMTDQQGFSIACVVVSADREAPPKDGEALDILNLPVPDIAGVPEPAEWLLYGPLPNRGFGHVDVPQQRVDLSDPDGWTPAFAQFRAAGNGRAAVFDFAARWTPNENVVGFALTHVKSPADRDAVILLGSDDGVEVWVNGTPVHRLDRGRGLKLDEDRAEIRLRAGWNRLLIKVYQGKGGWGLGMRIADGSGQPIGDLAYDPWGDLPDVLR